MREFKWPCVRDCPYRNDTCHCTCIAYKKAKLEHAEYKSKINKERNLVTDLNSFAVNSCVANRKKKNQREWGDYHAR